MTVDHTHDVDDVDQASGLVDVAALDRASAVEAGPWLRPCCASTRWVTEVLLGRPYGSVRALATASDDIVADLRWSDVAEALNAHPRIGQRAAGEDRESSWSRQEQSGATVAASGTAAALAEGNVAYEKRFGHVFLIRASGRTAEQMLAALQERLQNTTEVEREVVRHELGQIVRLRLVKTFR